MQQLKSMLRKNLIEAVSPSPFLFHMQGVQWITEDLFQQVLEEARASPRKRKNFNFHGTMEDNPHRFLNVMLQGTYIQPHRHLFPPKPESFLIIRGSVAFVVFDEAGKILECRLLGDDLGSLSAGGRGVDIEPGLWHTLVVLSDEAICYEVKPGPYRPADDKEFATWAPKEQDSNSGAFLTDLQQRIRTMLT